MKKLVIVLCLFWMGFIFYMSNNNGQISHEQSSKVVNIIQSTIEKPQVEAAKVTSENTSVNLNSAKTQQMVGNKLDQIIRKNAHAFMYMVLAFLVSSLIFSYNKRGKDGIINILFICLLYAVTDEFHQSFIPGRTSLVSDVLIDFGGALIGVTVFYLFYYKLYKKYALKV